MKVRTIVRRSTIVPLMLIISPLIFFINWCYEDTAQSYNRVKNLIIEDFWGEDK